MAYDFSPGSMPEIKKKTIKKVAAKKPIAKKSLVKNTAKKKYPPVRDLG